MRSKPAKAAGLETRVNPLYNVSEDPQETVDLALEPEQKGLIEHLTARVLLDWNPKAIREQMIRRRKDLTLLRSWAERTRPDDVIRWTMKGDMNWLDDA